MQFKLQTTQDFISETFPNIFTWRQNLDTEKKKHHVM